MSEQEIRRMNICISAVVFLLMVIVGILVLPLYCSIVLPMIFLQGVVNIIARLIMNDTFNIPTSKEGVMRKCLGFQIIPWEVNDKIEFKHFLKPVIITEIYFLSSSYINGKVFNELLLKKILVERYNKQKYIYEQKTLSK